MERMPYQPRQGAGAVAPAAPRAGRAIVTTDWQAGLPVLHGRSVVLRQLELSDAPALLALLTTEEVSRFISPPPTTVEGFERFITWTSAQRAAGRYACFAVVPEGMETAIGIFQLRALEPGFGTAEWGFALGSPFWGRGAFIDGAAEVLRFAFETVGVHRLEARSSVENPRGNGALAKLGAVREGVLRQSFLKDGRRHDQHLWVILHDDWLTTVPGRIEAARAAQIDAAGRHGDRPSAAASPASRVH